MSISAKTGSTRFTIAELGFIAAALRLEWRRDVIVVAQKELVAPRNLHLAKCPLRVIRDRIALAASSAMSAMPRTRK